MDVEEMEIQVVLSVFLTAGRNNGEGGSASLVKWRLIKLDRKKKEISTQPKL